MWTGTEECVVEGRMCVVFRSSAALSVSVVLFRHFFDYRFGVVHLFFYMYIWCVCACVCQKEGV